MEIYKALEQIVNGFNAFNKIQKIKSLKLRDESDNSVMRNKNIRIVEILQVVAEHSPLLHKNELRNAINKSNLYSDTYRSLKHHVASSRGQNMNKADVIKTLGIVKPVLGIQHQNLIEKIERIFQIINS